MLTKRNIVIAAVTVVLAVAGLFYAMSGPSREEKALLEALVRLRAAIAQGVNISEYHRLVTEVATRTDLARPKLGAVSAAAINYKIRRAAAAGLIWSEAMSGPCEDFVGSWGSGDPTSCQHHILEPMQLLGMVKDEAGFIEYFNVPSTAKILISNVLTVVDNDMDLAILSLQ